MSESDDFFEGKRDWSKIKDEILKKYMVPYLAKVNKRGQPILLIDGYAGPGIFDDKSYGSPIIMCEKAEEKAKGNWRAIFINNEKRYHQRLSNEIRRRGWSNSADARLGDARLVLKEISPILKDQTVFLYLDPFGLKGCDYNVLLPFLKRDSKLSTEIILTMNMPGVHRLAGRNTDDTGREDIQHNRLILTQTFGGEYWKEILLPDGIDAEQREFQLIEAYQRKLSQYFSYVRYCPVREGTGKRIKYFVVFASHHKDALVLLNDIMVKAYFAGMHQADFVDSLWENTDWREMRSINGLDRVVLDTICKYPGKTREHVWSCIVEVYFMKYLKTEYHDTVKRLVDAGKITFSSQTGQLNKDSILRPS